MGKTPIQWTDHSINPIRARNIETGAVGHFCVKISPGCRFCYSSKLQARFGTFPFLVENRPKVTLFLDEDKLAEVLRRKKPTRYFWCTMTDLFLADHPDEWIDRCFVTMALTPWHTHQVLTKRAERMQKYFRKGRLLLPEWIWIGVSVEDQQRADERIPLLLQTPAAVRFVSYEPALGPVDFRRYLSNGKQAEVGINWIICGGESGAGARPFDIGWGRSARDQCKASAVAFFMKQLGACPQEEKMFYPYSGAPQTGIDYMKLKDSHGGDPSEWPEDLRVREYPR